MDRSSFFAIFVVGILLCDLFFNFFSEKRPGFYSSEVFFEVALLFWFGLVLKWQQSDVKQTSTACLQILAPKY